MKRESLKLNKACCKSSRASTIWFSSQKPPDRSRFMESPHTRCGAHWDHELLAVPRRTESADKSDALQTLRARGRVSGPRGSVWSACVFSAAFPKEAAIRWSGRFMERVSEGSRGQPGSPP